ncbi:xanthine permease [Pelomyxa schiedti]|nr:xanthine permease [Pelomyxa schiedti]
MEFAVGFLGVTSLLLQLLSPVSVGPVICMIGLAIYPVAAPEAGLDWYIGGTTILLIVLLCQFIPRVKRLQRFFVVRLISMFSILIALILVWLVCLILSLVGVYNEGDASYTTFETMKEAPCKGGDYYACSQVIGAPIPNSKVSSLGIGMEGFGCLIAGLVGTGNGTTSYSENIAAISVTRVGSRRVIQVAGCVMIILGMFGKLGGFFASLPKPVIGGTLCSMFSIIVSVGLSSLQHVNLYSPRNQFVIGFSLLMGLSVPKYFQAFPVDFPNAPTLADLINTLFSTSMTVTLLLGVLLDNLLPGTAEERGLHTWGISATSRSSTTHLWHGIDISYWHHTPSAPHEMPPSTALVSNTTKNTP